MASDKEKIIIGKKLAVLRERVSCKLGKVSIDFMEIQNELERKDKLKGKEEHQEIIKVTVSDKTLGRYEKGKIPDGKITGLIDLYCLWYPDVTPENLLDSRLTPSGLKKILEDLPAVPISKRSKKSHDIRNDLKPKDKEKGKTGSDVDEELYEKMISLAKVKKSDIAKLTPKEKVMLNGIASSLFVVFEGLATKAFASVKTFITTTAGKVVVGTVICAATIPPIITSMNNNSKKEEAVCNEVNDNLIDFAFNADEPITFLVPKSELRGEPPFKVKWNFGDGKNLETLEKTKIIYTIYNFEKEGKYKISCMVKDLYNKEIWQNKINAIIINNNTGYVRVGSGLPHLDSLAIDGKCGSDNKSELDSIPIDLCSSGSSTLVLGNMRRGNNWNWGCLGGCGGKNDRCNARINEKNFLGVPTKEKSEFTKISNKLEEDGNNKENGFTADESNFTNKTIEIDKAEIKNAPQVIPEKPDHKEIKKKERIACHTINKPSMVNSIKIRVNKNITFIAPPCDGIRPLNVLWDFGDGEIFEETKDSEMISKSYRYTDAKLNHYVFCVITDYYGEVWKSEVRVDILPTNSTGVFIPPDPPSEDYFWYNGECGIDQEKTYNIEEVYYNLCSKGVSSLILKDRSNRWEWRCYGGCGGRDPQCLAKAIKESGGTTTILKNLDPTITNDSIPDYMPYGQAGEVDFGHAESSYPGKGSIVSSVPPPPGPVAPDPISPDPSDRTIDGGIIPLKHDRTTGGGGSPNPFTSGGGSVSTPSVPSD